MEYTSEERQSHYKMIIGRETINELKAVLYFNYSTIETNCVILPMQTL